MAFRRSPIYAIYWFAPSLKVPKIIHSAILLVLCVAFRGTTVSLGPNIDDGRTIYTFSTTGETRKIKQFITCKSNNLTYMIECTKMQKKKTTTTTKQNKTKQKTIHKRNQHRTSSKTGQVLVFSANKNCLNLELRFGHV